MQEFAYTICPINRKELYMEKTPTSIVSFILFLECPSWTSNEVFPPAVKKVYTMFLTFCFLATLHPSAHKGGWLILSMNIIISHGQ